MQRSLKLVVFHNIVEITKVRNIEWTGCVACMEKT